MSQPGTKKSAARDQGGFTLAEMLVAVTLLTLLTFAAVPRLAVMQGAFNRVNARGWLLQDIKRAQAETITQGCRGIIKIAADRRSYSYGCDYLAYDPSASPSPDKLTFRRNLPDKITVTTGAPIIFNSRGQTVDVNGIISSLTLSLFEQSNQFASGTLNGTGVFAYN